jgi:hypothetical protein
MKEGSMRARHPIAALFALLALGVIAVPALAATITYPSTVGYSDQPTLGVAGLKANTEYVLIIADRFGQPLTGIPFTSGADGSFSIPGFGPDPTDQPGAYTFSVVGAADNVTAATASLIVDGTNNWFLDKRLGS